MWIKTYPDRGMCEVNHKIGDSECVLLRQFETELAMKFAIRPILLRFLLLWAFCVPAFAAGGFFVHNAAFNGNPQYLGDGGSAQAASIVTSEGLALDAAGNLYVSDPQAYVIRKITPQGVVTTIAGNGTQGFSGDGGPATSAQLMSPYGLAVDASSNLYVADRGAFRIRKIDTSGTITTFAGNGLQGPETNGVQATTSAINFPEGIAFDPNGNLYIAESGQVRMVNTAGIISTFFNLSTTPGVKDIAIDAASNVYVTDGNYAVRMITQAGAMSVIAGTPGTGGASGDGGFATSATLFQPRGIAVNSAGAIFIVDAGNYKIRSVAAGVISTISGTGTPGLGANGVLATTTPINFVPTRIIAGPNGDLFYHDSGRIRRLSGSAYISPTITTLALPGGVVGTAYTNSLAATGTSPITWNLSFGSLPPGLTFLPNGTLQGTPTAVGTYTFQIDALNGGATNATQSYTIVISATPLPHLAVTPNGTMTFNTAQAVGTSSPPQSFLIYNNGSAPFQLTSLVLPASDYQVTAGGNCPALNTNFVPGATCTLNVVFSPVGNSFRFGQINVNTNIPSNQLLNMSGSGTASALSVNVSFNPPSISPGGTSVLTVTVSNTNAVAATGAGFNIGYPTNLLNGFPSLPASTCANALLSGQSNTGGFSSNNMTVPANNSCTASVTVSAASAGGYSVSMVANSLSSQNLPGNTNTSTATLTVTSAQLPAFTSSPPQNLVFPAQNIGTSSVSQPVTVTNSGTAPMTISAINITNTDYTFTHNCPIAVAALGAGLSCTVNVTFSPTQSGVDNAALTFSTNVPGSPQALNVFGTGQGVVAPIYSPSTTSLSFAPRQVGSPSPAQVVTITNAGSGTLSLGQPVVSSGDFSVQTATCNQPFATSCTMSVTFTPTALGARSGTITFSSNAPGSPHTINLSGTGQSSVTSPVATVSPPLLNFGSQAIGTTSASQRALLTNTGTGPMTIASIGTVGDFGFVSDCPLAPAVLAPASTCNIDATFSPLGGGSQSGAVMVQDDSPGNPHGVGLTGQGTQVLLPGIAVTPRALIFADRVVGSLSAPQTIQVSNTGQANLNLSSITVNGTAFQRIAATPASNDCGAVVAPQANCLIAIVFGPGSVGAASGSVVINHNASVAPITVTLAGNGTQVPQALIRFAIQFDFGDQVIGTQSAAKTLTIFNVGTAPLSISSILLAGPNASEFATGGNCVTSVSPGGNCSMTIGFNPVGTGAKIAEIDITSNAADAAVGNRVQLSGNGVPVPKPVVRVSATTLGFGNVIYGGLPAQRGITISNIGTGPLVITDIVLTGNRDFSQSNTCANGVGAQSQCDVTITFAPHGIGARSGVMTIRSNADNSPHQVQLGGSGCHYYSPTAARLFAATC